jgi:hypothetical protein
MLTCYPQEGKKTMPIGDPRDEYLDVSNNIRHFGTTRFAELTIYIALIAGMLNVTFGRFTPITPEVSIGLKITGLLITILFWTLQERTMKYWYAFMDRAVELEKELGFKQYSARPRPGIITGHNAVRSFFAIMFLFWSISLVLPT